MSEAIKATKNIKTSKTIDGSSLESFQESGKAIFQELKKKDQAKLANALKLIQIRYSSLESEETEKKVLEFLHEKSSANIIDYAENLKHSLRQSPLSKVFPQKQAGKYLRFLFLSFICYCILFYVALVHFFDYQIISNTEIDRLELAKQEHKILVREIIDQRTQLHKAGLIKENEVLAPINELLSKKLQDQVEREKRLEKIKRELYIKRNEAWWGGVFVIVFILGVILCANFFA